jgi:hypothetical protein
MGSLYFCCTPQSKQHQLPLLHPPANVVAAGDCIHMTAAAMLMHEKMQQAASSVDIGRAFLWLHQNPTPAQVGESDSQIN